VESRKGPLSIGLLWHSLRSPNLGWGALTISHLFMLNSAASEANRSLSVRVIGLNGPLWYPPRDITFEEVLVEPRKDALLGSPLWRSISDCDVILDVGGGDLFSDIYGLESFFSVSLARIASLAQFKPLVLSPQTIGPFKSSYAQSLATQIGSRCKRIFTRDPQSLAILGEMGLANLAEETADLAFRLPFKAQARQPTRVTRFGLNVSGLLYSEAQSQQNSFGLKADYSLLISRIIETLKRRRDVSLTLIPHVLGDARKDNDDLWICEKLAEQFDLQVAPRFTSPVEAKSFISGLDVLAGSRMHATIAALSSNVPVIPLAYSPKFSGVFRSVDYPLTCDLLSQDVDSVIEEVHSVIDRIADFRAAATRSNLIAQSKLDRYHAYLVEMMRA
jgi:colanic acid/amylovoran biosynthesis protein